MFRIFILIILFSPVVSHAQEENQEQATEQTNIGTEKAETPASKDKKEFETPESFDPSEKVSEDYSIPFPVDI